MVTHDKKWVHYSKPKKKISWELPGHDSTSSAWPNILRCEGYDFLMTNSNEACDITVNDSNLPGYQMEVVADCILKKGTAGARHPLLQLENCISS